MSFTPFKEIDVNNPGTATTYGSDDLSEIMKILNAKVVSNRQIKIKNPWQFQDNFDIVAASVAPPNPGANTKRLYVDPADNHLKIKSPAGAIIDIDVLGAASSGESNTVSNLTGSAGYQGLFKQKVATNFEFRGLNVASNKLSVALDAANNEVEYDVIETNLTLNNVGGVLGVTKGGTGLNTITSQALMRGAGTSNVALIAPGTNGHILTMVAGAPAWAAAGASADIKSRVLEAGVDVSVTTVGRKLNFSNADDFAITEDATANDRFDIALIRSESLVASWAGLSSVVKSNLPSTYTDMFTVPTNNLMAYVDGNGKNNFRFSVSWHKRGGSGTHSVRLLSTATTDVLAEIGDVVTGTTMVTGTIPTYFQDNVRTIKVQAKSTAPSDDPEFFGCYLWYK